MADSDPAPPPSPPAPVTAASQLLSSPSTKQDDLQPVAAKVAELNESQSELLARLQGLKQDLQNWRGKLDTQVKTYKDELSELKSRLNTDLGQLRSDFKDLKTTLQKQQEEVTASLRNLGLNDAPETRAETECRNGKDGTGKVRASSLDNTKEIKLSDDSVVESSQKENNTK
ncbi:hypothetical protein OPV22_024762 [Ensete ventricosum]|uniref:CAP-Gly domain-containing linker protein 1-like n=1 Tax=Ensete ventricosum TaxID=4639 RepID=A0AAV8QHM1_ENSVE|nr:hypothetical protein OPV22_024762 [Ensete ventricosum]